jgi:prolipoprotein diacylglyceryltransferase
VTRKYTTMKTRHSKLTKLTLWSLALLERSLVVWTLDSFPAFYGTRRFNTEFTRALHLSLSWARQILSTSPHPTSTRSILMVFTHLRFVLPSGLFPSDLPWFSLYLTLWSWALLERSLVVWTLDSFPAFYGTWRFNTEFTRIPHHPSPPLQDPS